MQLCITTDIEYIKSIIDSDLILFDKTTCKITNRFMGTGFNKYQFKWLALERNSSGHWSIKFAYANKYKTKDSQHILLNIGDQKNLSFVLENKGEGNYEGIVPDKKFKELKEYLLKHSKIDIFFNHFGDEEAII